MPINFCTLEGKQHLAVSLEQALVSMDSSQDFERLNPAVNFRSVGKFNRKRGVCAFAASVTCAQLKVGGLRSVCL